MENDIEEMEELCEEEESSYQTVDCLQQLGINASDIQKLKEGGYYTVGLISKATTKDLCNTKGLSDSKVEKILQACKKCCSFITGNESLHQREKIIKMTTGSKELDQLLGGGIETMSITEIFGEFRTGKTQLSHTLCVSCQLPIEMNGANGKVIFIDTEGTFRPERIIEISQRYGLNSNDVLDNILLARAYTHEQQMEILTAVAAKIVEDESPFRLLIIDSITALFRVDFSGRGELSERQQKLNKHLSSLKKLCEEFNIAVLIVNQVTADPGANTMFVADTKKPIGGNIIAHASTTRLYLRKGKGNNRICKIYDSPDRAESEATFAIGQEGIIDAE